MERFFYNLATDKYRGWPFILPKAILLVLSWAYAGAVVFLAYFSRLQQKRMQCKVISVGNITVGGTGKTALVEYIAGFLCSHSRKVAVVSRGYKKLRRTSVAADYRSMGDEPYMLMKKLQGVQVVVDPNRIAACRTAVLDHGADTVIFDDGLQQWKVYKDLEIVTIDSANPFGNGYLLPRGIMREPLSALRRADVFVLTKVRENAHATEIEQTLSRINPRALIAKAVHKPAGLYRLDDPLRVFPLSFLKGTKAGIFCGIGDPLSFERTCEELGLTVVAQRRFPDHHDFSAADLKEMARQSLAAGAKAMVTTQKDAARLSKELCAENLGMSLWVVCIEMRFIDNEEGFRARLRGIYSA